MLKQEFLELTGLKEISDEEYAGIEGVYNELDCDKEEFCQVWKSSLPASALPMRRYCVRLADGINRARRETARVKGIAKTLAGDIVVHAANSMRDAYGALGEAEAIRLKIQYGRELGETDRKYILEHLE